MKKITKFREIPKFTADGSYKIDCTFEYLLKMLKDFEENDGLILNPNFQRGHVWTEEQQTAWLEFFFRGGKTGRTLYFNKPDWNRIIPNGRYNEFVCVDGLQRITAIRRFLGNEIPIFGSFFNEFTDGMDFMRDTIQVNINNLRTEKEVLQWYIDMNAGGTPHSKEEIARVQELLENEERKSRCRDCAYLVEDESGNWVCDDCGKVVTTIPDENCSAKKNW